MSNGQQAVRLQSFLGFIKNDGSVPSLLLCSIQGLVCAADDIFDQSILRVVNDLGHTDAERDNNGLAVRLHARR